MNPQAVIAESRLMLTEFLSDLGLHREGEHFDLAKALSPFSAWVDQQTVTNDDRFYLAARLGAFICEYLIEHRNAERIIDGKRILLRLPIVDTVLREFDPYAVAIGIADKQLSLSSFLSKFDRYANDG